MKRLIALAAAGLALFTATRPRPSPRKPNIVLILIDTLRRDHLPFYGYPKDTAPFLSSLAARGVLFEHAYSTSGWTAPATSSLFTSLYPFQHGVLKGIAILARMSEKDPTLRMNRLPDAVVTIPEALRREGYRTFAITENPNLTHALGFDQGFDVFLSFPNEKWAERITAALQERRDEILWSQPYFLYLHYMDVHAPYRERPPFFDPNLEGDARRVSAYDSGIHHADEHIGQALRALGYEKNTLVVVTGDHGEELGERDGMWWHGVTLYAETLNVPLVVFPPDGLRGPGSVEDRVNHLDVLPTLRSFAGGAPSPSDEGWSLEGLIRGRVPRLAERTLYAHLFRPAGGAKHGESAIRVAIAGDMKLIAGSPLGLMLFDVRKDPRELTNLAGAFPDVVADLRQRFRDFERTSHKVKYEEGDVTITPEDEENLRALGYVN